MNKLKVKCIKAIPTVFKEGKEYEAFWDGDGYSEPKLLLCNDELGHSHIIAEHTLEDDLFKEHFIEIK